MMKKSDYGEENMRISESGDYMNQSMKRPPVAAGLDADFESVQHENADILVQFRSHLQRVEDLNSRLKFVLNEVHHVLQRRK